MAPCDPIKISSSQQKQSQQGEKTHHNDNMEHDTTNTSNLSLSRLIATYSRERLFVHPLLWTTRHLGLLRCRFLDLGVITVVPLPLPLPLPSPPLVPTYLASIYSDASIARRLATCRVPVTKGHTLSRLLLQQQLTAHGYVVWNLRRIIANLTKASGPFPLCPPYCSPASVLALLPSSTIYFLPTTGSAAYIP
jgi:hypothetical protein